MPTSASPNSGHPSPRIECPLLPESGQTRVRSICPLSANSGHRCLSKNFGGLRIHRTHVPVEEPSTASIADIHRPKSKRFTPNIYLSLGFRWTHPMNPSNCGTKVIVSTILSFPGANQWPYPMRVSLRS